MSAHHHGGGYHHQQQHHLQHHNQHPQQQHQFFAAQGDGAGQSFAAAAAAATAAASAGMYTANGVQPGQQQQQHQQFGWQQQQQQHAVPPPPPHLSVLRAGGKVRPGDAEDAFSEHAADDNNYCGDDGDAGQDAAGCCYGDADGGGGGVATLLSDLARHGPLSSGVGAGDNAPLPTQPQWLEDVIAQGPHTLLVPSQQLHVPNTNYYVDSRTLAVTYVYEDGSSIPNVNPLDTDCATAIKKMQRLARNRASAHLSRARKKNYIVYLEAQLNAVQAELVKMGRDNEALKAALAAAGGNVGAVIAARPLQQQRSAAEAPQQQQQLLPQQPPPFADCASPPPQQQQQQQQQQRPTAAAAAPRTPPQQQAHSPAQQQPRMPVPALFHTGFAPQHQHEHQHQQQQHSPSPALPPAAQFHSGALHGKGMRRPRSPADGEAPQPMSPPPALRGRGGEGGSGGTESEGRRERDVRENARLPPLPTPMLHQQQYARASPQQHQHQHQQPPQHPHFAALGLGGGAGAGYFFAPPSAPGSGGSLHGISATGFRISPLHSGGHEGAALPPPGEPSAGSSLFLSAPLGAGASSGFGTPVSQASLSRRVGGAGGGLFNVASLRSPIAMLTAATHQHHHQQIAAEVPSTVHGAPLKFPAALSGVDITPLVQR